ncbi:hypothetical protein E4U54_005968 [Claviceps lovelessii]|nr:hypothetical protein E4U54_005968 [Claviceps lovelessii]
MVQHGLWLVAMSGGHILLRISYLPKDVLRKDCYRASDEIAAQRPGLASRLGRAVREAWQRSSLRKRLVADGKGRAAAGDATGIYQLPSGFQLAPAKPRSSAYYVAQPGFLSTALDIQKVVRDESSQARFFSCVDLPLQMCRKMGLELCRNSPAANKMATAYWQILTHHFIQQCIEEAWGHSPGQSAR